MYKVKLTWSDGFIQNYDIHNPSEKKLEAEVTRIGQLLHVVAFEIKDKQKVIAKGT